MRIAVLGSGGIGGYYGALLADNVETAESQLTEGDVFRRDLEWLSACDVLVVPSVADPYPQVVFVGPKACLIARLSTRSSTSRNETASIRPSPGWCGTPSMTLSRTDSEGTSWPFFSLAATG